MDGGSSLENIAKDCWVFFPCVEGFPKIFLVHGYSSCDLGLLQLVIVVAVIVYGSSNDK